MAIPALDERGLLPEGRHTATLEEIQATFCVNAHREQLWQHLIHGFLPLLTPLTADIPPPPPTIVLGGSFFSDKEAPDDIEATLVFHPSTAGRLCWKWYLIWQQNHAEWKETYRVDFYPSLPGAHDFSAFFGYVGPKTAEAKGLHERDKRGTLALDSW